MNTLIIDCIIHILSLSDIDAVYLFYCSGYKVAIKRHFNLFHHLIPDFNTIKTYFSNNPYGIVDYKFNPHNLVFSKESGEKFITLNKFGQLILRNSMLGKHMRVKYDNIISADLCGVLVFIKNIKGKLFLNVIGSSLRSMLIILCKNNVVIDYFNVAGVNQKFIGNHDSINLWSCHLSFSKSSSIHQIVGHKLITTKCSPNESRHVAVMDSVINIYSCPMLWCDSIDQIDDDEFAFLVNKYFTQNTVEIMDYYLFTAYEGKIMYAEIIKNNQNNPKVMEVPNQHKSLFVCLSKGRDALISMSFWKNNKVCDIESISVSSKNYKLIKLNEFAES